jgi:hypothetical protein
MLQTGFCTKTLGDVVLTGGLLIMALMRVGRVCETKISLSLSVTEFWVVGTVCRSLLVDLR